MTTKRLWAQSIVFVIFTVMSFSSLAVGETFEFENDQAKRQYLSLTETLRCPKCQNQNIADSNAPIAKDMRKEVYRLVQEGKTSEDVVGFMVDRFGDFVDYKPKMDASTWVLWFGPLILGLIGFFVVVAMARKNRMSSNESIASDAALSKDDKEKLRNLLDD